MVLDDGVAIPPVVTYPDIPSRTAEHDVWSPDSEHVLLSTVGGPAVTNGYADVVLRPATGDEAVRAAGWRGNDTVLGVRPAADGGLDIVARGLAEPGWSTVGTVAADAVAGAGSLSRVFASPDGSRLLLVLSASGVGPGSDSERAVLVDARTGARVPFTGETSAADGGLGRLRPRVAGRAAAARRRRAAPTCHG